MPETLKDAVLEITTQSAIAKACDVSQQAVSLWLRQGKVPAKRAKKFHELTGIPMHTINPEVFESGELNG